MDKNDSRRKLLKGVAAGSGAIVAGKTLPETWTKPVVDSVMLPVHAQASPIACSTIIVNFNIIVTGTINNGGAGYSIFPAGSCNELDGDGGAIEGGIDFTNYSTSHTYDPGQYVVKAGFSGDPGSSSIIGRITTSCCTGDSVTLVDMTITGASGGDNGCALVTLSEDGSCMIELLPEPCPCP